MDFKGYYVDRGYELIIGDYKNDPNNALLIENLQINFEVSKSISNKDKTNSATIEIYNLHPDERAILDKEFIAADFKAGYYNTEIKRLFAGEVNQVTTRKQGTDIVTQVRMGAGYSQIGHGMLNSIVPAGSTIKDVYEEIRKTIKGVNRGVYGVGANFNNPVIDGYPLSGQTKAELNKLAAATRTQWQIDNGVLYVAEVGSGWMKNEGQAILISFDSGLIDRAYKVPGEGLKKKQDPAKSEGIQFTAFLNADLIPGCIVKIEQDDPSIDGYYTLTSSRFTGTWRSGNWIVECRCSKRINPVSTKK